MDIGLTRHLRAKTEAARVVAQHVLGPKLVLKNLGNGEHNCVFLASSDKDKVVIRIGDRTLYTWYKQAVEAAGAAAKQGVPVPAVRLLGRKLVPYAYQVSEFVEGIPGDHYEGDQMPIWRQIGEEAYKINRVQTVGLEYHLFHGRKERSWTEHISSKLKDLEKFWPDYRHWNSRNRKPFFSGPELSLIFQAMEPLKSFPDDRRCLIHIDLAPRNVLVDKNGKLVAVIDWDNAKSFPAPHQIATTTFWLSADEANAFRAGYGVNFEPKIIKAFQLYEYMTQIPHKPLKIANAARDRILWLVLRGGMEYGQAHPKFLKPELIVGRRNLAAPKGRA